MGGADVGQTTRRNRDGSPAAAGHARPVNIAGIPWENVQALRRKGSTLGSSCSSAGRLHHEADWSLDRHGPLPQKLAQQFAAFAKLAPQTDIFHFYFGLTLIPKSIQFPLLRALRKKSIFHYLGSDIRGKTPAELAYGKRADAEIVGSYDAHALGARGARDPARPRPAPVHARATVRQPAPACRARAVEPREEGNCAGDRDARAIARRPRPRRGRPARGGPRALCAADIVVDQLNAGWHGVFALESMALGKPVVTYLKPDVVEKSAAGYGIRIPIVPATADTLADALRPLIESPALRREIGAASRAYVEQVHDIDRIADRLIDLYRSL